MANPGENPNGRTGAIEHRLLAIEAESRTIRNGYGEAVSRSHDHTERVERDLRAEIAVLRQEMEADDRELHVRLDEATKGREPKWYELTLVKRGLTFAAFLLVLGLLSYGIIRWDDIEKGVGLAESVAR